MPVEQVGSLVERDCVQLVYDVNVVPAAPHILLHASALDGSLADALVADISAVVQVSVMQVRSYVEAHSEAFADRWYICR